MDYHKVFSWQNFTQVATWIGILRWIAAAGIVHLTPELQDQIAHYICYIIAGLQAAIGLFDIWRDSRKHVIVTPVPTIIKG